MTSHTGHAVTVVGPRESEPYAAGVLAVWEQAFGPVEDHGAWFAATWDRHRSRAGYRLALAVLGERVVGFAWAYTGERGQYWPDLVASRLGAAAEDWVGGCTTRPKRPVDSRRPASRRPSTTTADVA